MSRYDFILDSMVYSFSSVNSFEPCPGCFKLTYIESEPRIGNAFSDYGNLVHEILELFFKDKLKKEDMNDYYLSHFEDAIETAFPPYPAGMKENYLLAGSGFFQNFEFDKSLYDIIFIEDFVNSIHNGIEITVKPDLILREKSTDLYYLIDYKTAKMKKGKNFKDQIQEYKNQFLLYSYFLWIEKGIIIDKLKIWFIRDNVEHVIKVDPLEVAETVIWFEDTIKKIKEETEWKFKEKTDYFCQQICSQRNSPNCKCGSG